MMATFDPTTDLRLVADLQQQVTLRRFDTLVEEVIPHALHRALSLSLLNQVNGMIHGEDARFHLLELTDIAPPRPNDQIIDAEARRWLIREVQYAVEGSRWSCLCRLIET
ncbi:MAG: hypothetical protein SFX18_01715 [Pirellulales bacterium]|nr:hypothetical protein [Pirellulales bacterium]